MKVCFPAAGRSVFRMFKLWLFCFVPEAWGVVVLWGIFCRVCGEKRFSLSG